jgi:hypothetical protein
MIGRDKLNDFIGTWTGEERLLTTPWTSAGIAEGTFVIAEAPHGGVLIDYAETRDGSTALCGHGVLVEHGWWWFDSFGFVPMEPGSASWDTGSLALERRSQRGRTIMRLSIQHGTLLHEIQTAVPADAELTPMLIGRYERQSRGERELTSA